MSRQQILYLIDHLGMGGAERLLAIYLQHFDLDRFEPRVCALQVRDENRMAPEIERLGIPIDIVPVKHMRDIQRLPALVRYLRQHKVQLVHTQLEFADTFGTLAARWLKIPTVTTLHTFDAPAKGSKADRRLQLRWWVLRHFNTRAIAVSEGTRQHHLQYGQLSPQKVTTLYNGIDLSRFNTTQDSIRQRNLRNQLGLPQAAQILTTVAVLRQPKGLQYMLQAMPSILAAAPQTHYLIVGDGSYRQTLESMVADLNLNQHVTFAGLRRDIPDILALSDIFVLPTLGEALPTVLAEAMAAAKPIIASDVGGVPEMIVPAQNGLLVPAEDPVSLSEACLSLCHNPTQAIEMGRIGRQIVEEKFNITHQVKKLGDLYQQILKTNKQPVVH